jgi:hypothetical protein
MTAEKKRRDPEEVEPVQHGGLSYEVPRLGTPFGYVQDGGFVTARDAVTGALVWSQRIYVVEYGDDIEDDKQEVFIKALTLAEDGRALLLVDERGERYRVGLVDRSVERLKRTE